jgi:hypothetical protein
MSAIKREAHATGPNRLFLTKHIPTAVLIYRRSQAAVIAAIGHNITDANGRPVGTGGSERDTSLLEDAKYFDAKCCTTLSLGDETQALTAVLIGTATS